MPDSFSPDQYGPVFAPLVSGDRRRPLDSGSIDASLAGKLRSLSITEAFGHTSVSDQLSAEACLSALWLLADDLDASHTISQSIDTADGSFWHGIMHRREGDFGNAKYWFRRVGDHPVFGRLSERFGSWDPFEMVDACEQAARSGAGADGCLDRQQAEWETLFDWCYRCASGQQAEGSRP